MKSFNKTDTLINLKSSPFCNGSLSLRLKCVALKMPHERHRWLWLCVCEFGKINSCGVALLFFSFTRSLCNEAMKRRRCWSRSVRQKGYMFIYVRLNIPSYCRLNVLLLGADGWTKELKWTAFMVRILFVCRCERVRREWGKELMGRR